jgi:hypothetical protein
MNIILKLLGLLICVTVTTTGIAQSDFDETPCDYKVYASNHEVVDRIEFYVFYISKVDLENENCSYALAEDYYNIAPDMQTNTLCVIYINEEKSATLNKILYIDLFDNTNRHQSYLEAIQLVFVTDRRTHLWKEYISKEEIENVFSLDIHGGILDEK